MHKRLCQRRRILVLACKRQAFMETFSFLPYFRYLSLTRSGTFINKNKVKRQVILIYCIVSYFSSFSVWSLIIVMRYKLAESLMFVPLLHMANIAFCAGPSSREASNIPKWTSPPFDNECLHCTNQIGRPSTFNGVSIPNRNCTIQCNRGSTLQRRVQNQNYRKIQIRNKVSGSRSECLIGVLSEDIFCATVSIHSTGVRKLKFSCKRRNQRYFLPNPSCDDGHTLEVGEESCRKVCATTTGISKPRYVDLVFQRATYQTCYQGWMSESYRFGNRGTSPRGRYMKFCRAELSPCSNCFQWGNWTAVTPCSRTCGHAGARTWKRQCYVMERTGLYGGRPMLGPIHNDYCKAHLGGMDTKTERCETKVDCFSWTQWSQWSECVNNQLLTPPPSDVTKKNGCKQRRKRDVGLMVTSMVNDSVTNPATDSLSINDNTLPVARAFLKANILPEYTEKLNRTRKCVPESSGPVLCQGNSTEYKACDVKRKQYSNPTIVPETSTTDCEEDIGADQGQTTSPVTTNIPSELTRQVSTEATNFIITEEATSSLPKVRPDKPVRKNNNYTVSDDGGFTTVLNAYAPALIAGLLIFIVLLLIALIAICGTRVMQKSRRTRYEVGSPPSFSAGTMGSIPSGLVHGFSHVLGLRHGSGTFGRSEGTMGGHGNASDGVSNKGSCRSVASSNKRPQIPPALSLAYSSNSVLHSSPHQRIALQELSTRSMLHESNMGTKKPSDSSLLSSASSSGAGVSHPVPPNSCSFQPLPPIPPHQSPHLLGDEKSVLKRATSRSSSLNPYESNRSARAPAYSQPRAESISGRVTGRSHGLGNDGFTPKKFAHTPVGRIASRGRTGSSSSDARRLDTDNAGDATDTDMTENEYWTVTRPGFLDTEDESFILTHHRGEQHTPRAKPREKKSIMPIQGERTRENHSVLSLKLSRETVVEESDSSEMIDNILYAQSPNTSACQSHDETEDYHDDELGVARSSSTTSQPYTKSGPFYNAIKPSQSVNAPEPDPPEATEGDYDHLCDQFGGPNSTKGRGKYPGTMTSLHYLRNDEENSHDYESIEFEGRKRNEKV